MSRIENSIKNIKYSVASQAVNFILVFITRKIFLFILSSEYLGLNGLFSDILSMLSLAELGIGTAITYCLYKPLAANDYKKINSLMLFYKKAYYYIGIFVFVIGMFLTPFLKILIVTPDIKGIELIYAFFVINSAASYFLTYKRNLLLADQKRYINVIIHQLFVFLMNVMQILFLLITHNYFAYLIIMIACTISENIFTSIYVNKKYIYLNIKSAKQLSPNEKKEIYKNVRAMMSHRIGGVIVNGTDNLIMAKFVGIVSVGLYSNYFLIKNTLVSITNMLFQSIIASIGNLNVDKSNKSRKKEVFYILYFASAWLFGFTSICLICLYNPFVSLWVGKEYIFNYSIVVIIVLNYYISGMRQVVLTTRDAMGIFWYDRYKPIFESIINLILSIPLSISFGIKGVLLGTFFSTLTTSFWVEPYVLFKYGLSEKLNIYFKKYITYTFTTLLNALLTYLLCNVIYGTGLLFIIIKLIFIAVFSNLFYILCYHRSKEFVYILTFIKNKINKIKF